MNFKNLIKTKQGLVHGTTVIFQLTWLSSVIAEGYLNYLTCYSHCYSMHAALPLHKCQDTSCTVTPSGAADLFIIKGKCLHFCSHVVFFLIDVGGFIYKINKICSKIKYSQLEVQVLHFGLIF